MFRQVNIVTFIVSNYSLLVRTADILTLQSIRMCSKDPLKCVAVCLPKKKKFGMSFLKSYLYHNNLTNIYVILLFSRFLRQ